MSPELMMAISSFTASYASATGIIDRIANTIYAEVPREDFQNVSQCLMQAYAIIMRLQGEMTALRQENLKLHDKCLISESYPIVEIRPGFFARRIQDIETVEESSIKRVAYVCQRCAEEFGLRIVLQSDGRGNIECPRCKTAFSSGLAIR